MNDVVEVLLAVRNGDEYLEALIASLHRQTYSNWRVLVSDDGSTDRSMDLVDSWAKLDPRVVRILNSKQWGSAERHFRQILRTSTADYVMFCDQDDVWREDKIAASMAAMRSAEARSGRDVPILVFSDACVVDSDLKVLDESFMHYAGIDPRRVAVRQLLAQNPVLGCTCLMNRSLATLMNRTPPETYVRMHDRWAALLAAALGLVVYLDEQTIFYRQHGANVLGAETLRRIAKRPISKLDRSVNESVRMARSFLEVYAAILPNSTRELVRAYSELPSYGRAKRLWTLLRFRTVKGGVVRMAAQVLFVLRVRDVDTGRNSVGR